MAYSSFKFVTDETYDKVFDMVIKKMNEILADPNEKTNATILKIVGVEAENLSKGTVEDCLEEIPVADGVSYRANDAWVTTDGETKKNKFLKLINFVTLRAVEKIANDELKVYLKDMRESGEFNEENLREETNNFKYRFYVELHKQFNAHQSKNVSDPNGGIKAKTFNSKMEYLFDSINGAVFMAYLSAYKNFDNFFAGYKGGLNP